jgi:hypothetical protein
MELPTFPVTAQSLPPRELAARDREVSTWATVTFTGLLLLHALLPTCTCALERRGGVRSGYRLTAPVTIHTTYVGTTLRTAASTQPHQNVNTLYNAALTRHIKTFRASGEQNCADGEGDRQVQRSGDLDCRG